MHHFYLKSIPAALAHISRLNYPEIFLIIIASGHPLPVPEGIIFIGLGVLAAHGGSFLGYWVTAVLAVFCYDVVLFGLAYAGSRLAEKMSRKIKADWIEKYTGASGGRALFLVFVSHFVPGWRMVNPLICGALRLKPRDFFFYTICSALVYPALYLAIGFFLFLR
ncbi:MAG: yohD [Parcubacteria group bacterium]|nr:yohD [Parcubacteria group bacterium]